MKKKNEKIESVPLRFGPDLTYAVREAYNYLRANITFSFPNKDKCKVLGVTSAVPQEGKSCTSINLAYILAMDGDKVLLIDGDLRKMTLGSYLNLPTKPGLADLVLDKNAPALYNKILNENLSVIMAGTLPPNPTELLGSTELADVIEHLKKSFDYIVFDLPPVNVVSDAIVVSQLLDGIVFVTRNGFSLKREVTEAINKIKFSKTRILGVVYNDYNDAPSSHYKHYNGKYYSKYGGYGKYGSYGYGYGYGGYGYGYYGTPHQEQTKSGADVENAPEDSPSKQSSNK